MASGRTFLSIVLLVVLNVAHQPSVPPISPRWSSSLQAQSASAPPSTVSCTPEKPIVWPKEIIQLRLWITQPSPTAQYAWTVTGGQVESHGTEARWDFTDVQPGYYTATVRYDDTAASETCSVQVVVEERPGDRGLQRETGHDLLIKGTSESEGYGLYSYFLLGAPPDDNSRERCLKLMEAFLQQVPSSIADLEKYFDRRQLTIAYVPVDASPETPPSAQWLLQHYDYARSRFLMRSLSGTHQKGPYLVSSLKPLSEMSTLSGPYLNQDLSSVPPHLISLWVAGFLNQVAQEHFWEESSGKKLVLKLRTTIGILAAGLPDVRKGLDDWIAWTH
jgi:hypothetical protein